MGLHSLLRRSPTKASATQTSHYDLVWKSPIYSTKNLGYRPSRPREAQVNAIIAFSGIKPISQWPLTVLATRVSHYIVNNRRCHISLRIRSFFSKIPHMHNYYGSLIPWMDLWCWRYKVNLGLVNFRVHFEPPIASQNVTKVPYLLTCLLTTWPQYGVCLTSCHKKWYIMFWKGWSQYHLVLRELWVTDIT